MPWCGLAQLPDDVLSFLLFPVMNAPQIRFEAGSPEFGICQWFHFAELGGHGTCKQFLE
jgi:hypothetical protein